MGRYYDMVKANFNKLRNDEASMWKHIELVDELLEEMAKPHKERYWKVLRDTHEIMYGKHFNREYAEWEVEQMFHKDKEGRVYRGEHWSYDATTGVMSSYKTMLPSEVTPCDFYVALNAQWHDYHCFMREHLPEEEAEEAIIESAVKFWFLDDDWEDAEKVWEYFRMKNR